MTRRFGVGVDRVVEHVVQSKRRRSAASRRADLVHMDDCALAAACIDRASGSWDALADLFEPGLIAAAELHVGGARAIVTVRRLLTELRLAPTRSRPGRLDLRRYAGDLALQSWLVERLMEQIGVEGEGAAVSRRRAADQRTRLALLLLGESRLHMRRAVASDAGACRSVPCPPPSLSSGPNAPAQGGRFGF